jgi:hypothetical protein
MPVHTIETTLWPAAPSPRHLCPSQQLVRSGQCEYCVPSPRPFCDQLSSLVGDNCGALRQVLRHHVLAIELHAELEIMRPRSG